jgi:PAS domain S-box-containing protein
MSTVKASYEELQQRLREVEGLLGAIRTGKVDSVVSAGENSNLLVLREYELELQRERQLTELQVIIETVPAAVAIVWPDGEIRLANRAFLDVAGLGTCTTLWAWAARLRAHDKFADDLEERLSRSLRQAQQLVPLAATFTTHAGKELHWVMTFQQLPGQVEERPIVMVAGTDITEEKRLNTQLSDTKRQMEDFLAAAAHDLKAPLITIAHNVTFARMGQGDTLTAETAECLDHILAAEKDMLSSLCQVSAVLRAGRDTEPRELHSFHELARTALRQLEGTIVQRRAEVVFGDSLPELYCQGTKFVQVFSNLISNAIKYTPAERTPHVEVGYKRRPGREYVFFVRDNGSGISQDCLEKVFGLFERLSADADISGQGVGLTVVKRIVELHGGRVWAESVAGEGSTFYFTVGKQRRDDHACND